MRPIQLSGKCRPRDLHDSMLNAWDDAVDQAMVTMDRARLEQLLKIAEIKLEEASNAAQ